MVARAPPLSLHTQLYISSPPLSIGYGEYVSNWAKLLYRKGKGGRAFFGELWGEFGEISGDSLPVALFGGLEALSEASVNG